MKVISEAARDGDISCEDDAKSRTDVQDILADNEISRVGSVSGSGSGLTSVLPGLALGGAGAVSGRALRALAVTCVVSAAPELPDTPLPERDTPFLRVPVKDAVDEDLSPHFDLVADLIEQVRVSGGCTLVHCVAGVSRSAALCLAYLVRHQGFSLRDAFFHLRAKRPQVRPNTGFFRQLIKYEEQLTGQSSVKIVFNEAADRDIPDVYVADYELMLSYGQRYCITSRYSF